MTQDTEDSRVKTERALCKSVRKHGALTRCSCKLVCYSFSRAGAIKKRNLVKSSSFI